MINQDFIQHLEDSIKNDLESLAKLFQFYQPKLYVEALRLVGNPLAQDVLQDTFLAAVTHISSLRNNSLFYPWLKKILLNNCYQILRQEKSAFKWKSSLTDAQSIEDSIEKKIEKVGYNSQLYCVMGNLSEDLRACVLLRYFSKFGSYQEIAQIMGIPIGTVRSRLAAAREKMYAVFSNYDDTTGQEFLSSLEWSDYYLQIWKNFYADQLARKEFISQLHPHLQIRLTSGKIKIGKKHLEEEFDQDLQFGSQFLIKNVNSCGNISILEGTNSNPTEYPERCAPSTVIVLFRKKHDLVETLNIYDSPRS